MINIEGCSFDALAEGNRWKKKKRFIMAVSHEDWELSNSRI